MDIRWQQRLTNYSIALSQLKDAIDTSQVRALSDLEKQGTIQAFEYCFELAWNTIKDFYEYQGFTEIQGSRDAFRLAFKQGLIDEGDIWMGMIKSRALTSHTYNQSTANQVLEAIKTSYIDHFLRLEKTLQRYERDE